MARYICIAGMSEWVSEWLSMCSCSCSCSQSFSIQVNLDNSIIKPFLLTMKQQGKHSYWMDEWISVILCFVFVLLIFFSFLKKMKSRKKKNQQWNIIHIWNLLFQGYVSIWTFARNVFKCDSKNSCEFISTHWIMHNCCWCHLVTWYVYWCKFNTIDCLSNSDQFPSKTEVKLIVVVFFFIFVRNSSVSV